MRITNQSDKQKTKPEVDWIIHMVANGNECALCGCTENHFLPGLCDFHTHGMDKYGHQEFQVVLRMPDGELKYILNVMGLLVQSGRRFKAGDLVSEIYMDCKVRLDEFESNGDKVLRVIIPDKNNRFPEDKKCDDIFKRQLLENLYVSSDDVN